MEPHELSSVRFDRYSVEGQPLVHAFIQWTYAAELWKIKKESDEWEAVQIAKKEAWAKEKENGRLERHEVDRLRFQQQEAACASFFGSRKRDFPAMGSPLASRSVFTFNAKV